jgi:hypothetical protein
MQGGGQLNFALSAAAFLRQSSGKTHARARAFIAERSAPGLLVVQASVMDAGKKLRNFERAAPRLSHRSECMQLCRRQCVSICNQ